jgi:hypothetical protein
VHVLTQFLVREVVGAGSDRHEVRPRRHPVGPGFRQDRPETPTHAVAHHGFTHSAGHREGRKGQRRCRPGSAFGPRRPGRAVGPILVTDVGDGDRSRRRTGAVPAQVRERRPVADPSDQADSLWRPFRRRARTTARPARVDMRWRNPCRLARRRLFGWYVRFTLCLLDAGGARRPMRSRTWARDRGELTCGSRSLPRRTQP